MTRALRILIVDDDLFIGTLMAEILVGLGHEVCGIETTEPDAVRAALTNKPDLMIVDAQLGNGSGIAAVEAISRIVTIPHIFMSGNRLSLGQSHAIVLQKPFRPADLQSAINRAIGGNGLLHAPSGG